MIIHGRIAKSARKQTENALATMKSENPIIADKEMSNTDTPICDMRCSSAATLDMERFACARISRHIQLRILSD